MLHDHAKEHGGRGNPDCDKKGFMSYGHHESGWSTCSKADFQAQYEFRHAPSYGIHWCLPEAPTACGLEPPPPSTTNPPATTTETATTSAPAPFAFTNCVVDWCLQANTKDQYTKC